MMWLLAGGASFALFVWFDARKLRRKSGGPLFLLGAAVLTVSALGLLSGAGEAVGGCRWRFLWGAGAVLSLAALFYVLFFALPAKKTYGGDGETTLCASGCYALCRHPGFWPFLSAAVFASLYGGTALIAAGTGFWTVLDLLYIYLQDQVFFPRYIEGYDDYRRQTPFLLPTKASFAAFRR